MAIVSGPIKLVTDRPSAVTQVLVSAAALRLHGAGIVVDHPDAIPVVGGVVEFEALPGTAVLTMVSVGGAPMESVEIVVPDSETATLAECLDQIYVYDPPVVGRAQEFARQAGDAADRAEAGADRVGSAEQVGVWAGEAVASAKGARDDAERAEGAAAAADAAAGETSTLIRDEMDAKVEEADGHAQSAGRSATLAGGHAEATGDDRRQTGEDRQATGEDVDETEELTAASIAAASLVEGVVAEALGQYRGTGFPNGKVSAPVGSIYTDTAATAGAIRWIKVSGTGTSGWEVIEGSTGRRDITDPDHDGQLYVTRIGSRVIIELVNLLPNDLTGVPGSVQVGILSDGFRARNRNIGYITRANSIADVHRLWIDSYNISVVPGITTITAWEADRPMTGSMTFETNHSWPTSLPGTPA